jgi:DNA-binding transcriptional LysR family regulator
LHERQNLVCGFFTAHGERSVDLLFGRHYGPFAEDDLESGVLFDDQPVVVSGRQSRWARPRRLELADLSQERWILPPPDRRTVAKPMARRK